MPDRRRLQAVAETKAFADDIDAMLSDAERAMVIESIARQPDGGDLIPGAGGLRKRRIPLPGRGTRRGARVITLYLGESHPVYAVFVYAKNERETLSPAQTRTLLRLVEEIKTTGAKEDESMRKNRFEKLTESLGQVRAHVSGSPFAGRISKIAIEPPDIRAVRERSGMTQQQFAATFGIGLGTLQKWERGERRPSGAAKSLLLVMQNDLPAVVKALDVATPRRSRRVKQPRRAA